MDLEGRGKNHGDRFLSPFRLGLDWTPGPLHGLILNGLLNGDDPNYLLNGVILQVGVGRPGDHQAVCLVSSFVLGSFTCGLHLGLQKLL